MKPLKIAIQKSGRLNEKSVELLKNSGFVFENYKSSLIAPVANFPLEILFLRDDDIPEYVQDGIADLGIVGMNVTSEAGVAVAELLKLGFGRCRLSIAIPNGSAIANLQDLNGKSIATTYPNLLSEFLKKENIASEVRTISGSVEISTNLGLSDAICDLVSTGGTLKSNGLVPFHDILHSEAVLIGRQETPVEHKEGIQEIQQRIQSVLRARDTKYVVLNIARKDLATVTALLPGIKSPTVVPLADEGWVAVHTVIPEGDFWEKINQLRACGAQGIVVLPIEKIIL